jgi:hypothetical protein
MTSSDCAPAIASVSIVGFMSSVIVPGVPSRFLLEFDVAQSPAT